jgi:protein ImuB
VSTFESSPDVACESGPDAALGPSPRRIFALILPEILCEITTRITIERKHAPFGVVLVPPADVVSSEPLRATTRLDAVSVAARRLGVRAGQTIAEASALCAGFDVHRLAPATVESALSAVAEVALGFGATVALSLPDTVWVDVSGSAHLFGGEAALGEELSSRVRALGHVVRVAVAEGPVLAQAFARWAPPAVGKKAVHAVAPGHAAEAVSTLPVVALPLGEECQSWLVRLGVLTLGDLAALPRSALGSRLDGEVTRALELANGSDPTPLVAYQPPRSVIEEVNFEHGVSGLEPLRFALRGLTSRLSARLGGRGMAAESLLLSIEHDRSIAALRGAEATTQLKFALSTPLFREEDLQRVVASRLERTRLSAPSVALRLEALVLVPAVESQLELGQAFAGSVDHDQELPLVLAELMADIGETRVGVLEVLDAHRLEARSTLAPAITPELRPRGKKSQKRAPAPRTPLSVHVSGSPLEVVEGGNVGAGVVCSPLTRLLPEPVRLDSPLRIGATLAVDRRLYTIEALRFEHRLHAVEWWTGSPVMRDYVRVWLKSVDGVIEALAYVDRENGKRYLQAVAD